MNPKVNVVKKQAKSKGSKSKVCMIPYPVHSSLDEKIPILQKRKQVEQSEEEEVDSESLSCEKPVTIGKDDFISQLPADCLDAVFTLLSQ